LSDPKPAIILYSRPTCPLDSYIKSVLESAKAHYVYVDVRFDEEAREHLREINKGYESVPTLVFPDGSSLTEPLPHQLREKLMGMGYDMSKLQAWGVYLLKNPMHYFVLLMLIFAVLRWLGVF
jgi:mycoredoxin